jgi:hypothetical protein
VIPTGVKIEGPTRIKAGTRSDLFQALLVANGETLGGEPALDWQLGSDCDGIAEFAAVLGSQDTGGPDPSRRLETKSKGTCTVVVGVRAGSPLHATFKPQTFTTKLALRESLVGCADEHAAQEAQQTPELAWPRRCERNRSGRERQHVEVPLGIEPRIVVLQTTALPFGDGTERVS